MYICVWMNGIILTVLGLASNKFNDLSMKMLTDGHFCDIFINSTLLRDI